MKKQYKKYFILSVLLTLFLFGLGIVFNQSLVLRSPSRKDTEELHPSSRVVKAGLQNHSLVSHCLAGIEENFGSSLISKISAEIFSFSFQSVRFLLANESSDKTSPRKITEKK